MPAAWTGAPEHSHRGTATPRPLLVRRSAVHLACCTGSRVAADRPCCRSALHWETTPIDPDTQTAAAPRALAESSDDKMAAAFSTLLGMTLSRGARARATDHAGTRPEPHNQRVLASSQATKRLSSDEMGWRRERHLPWLGARADGAATGSDSTLPVARVGPGAGQRVGMLGHDESTDPTWYAGALHRRTRDDPAAPEAGSIRRPQPATGALNK